MSNDSVWIVDDDKSIRFVLERALSNFGMAARTFDSVQAVLSELEDNQPKVILTDIRMPGLDGHELMRQVKTSHPEIPIVVMTAYSDLESTVTSFSEGAFEYLSKPFDIDEVHSTLQRALAQRKTDSPIESKEAVVSDAIIGQAPAMQEAYRAIGRLSQSSATVLITGETGTGKELVANALHTHSPRSESPFVALNMAALPNDLIEAELFGFEKGAFTGANARRIGLFEQADSGTLFLDEIADMPLTAQTRLLRVLSDGSFYRIGGRESITVDVRIIAATHGDMEHLVRDGQFREDLYHRLNVIRIHVPPLRDRKSDIVELTRKFMREAADNLGVETKTLTDETLTYLESLDWPGNVRQLENTCHWLTVMAPGREVVVSDLPPELHVESRNDQISSDWSSSLRAYIQEHLDNGGANLLDVTQPMFEKTLIDIALNHTSGHKQEAAKLIGYARNTLSQKINKYNIV
ncbi:MAG: nitrogen regulation protein NR(I) [Gammaproteobacteria bacterium]|nr:nitrogen regulation protein NR(I) [Gammaproteobacteria bacterium]